MKVVEKAGSMLNKEKAAPALGAALLLRLFRGDIIPLRHQTRYPNYFP